MTEASICALLGIPNVEIVRKIREMTLQEKLRFSLVSEKCKDMIKSVKIEGTSIRIAVSDGIRIAISTDSRLMHLTYYTESDKYWGMGANGRKKKLTAPQSVFIREFGPIGSNSTESFWTKNNLTMKDWLRHLQEIFNCDHIDNIWFDRGSREFDIFDVKETFGKITEVIIGDTGNYTFNQMILQEYFPVEKLAIKTDNFEDSKIPPSNLIQNFAELWIDKFTFNEPTVMALDDLLMTNSKVIQMESNLPANQFNKFIKLWQGGSNPHMECLRISYSNGQQAEEHIIMKGIKYEVNPLDRVRNFKSAGFGNPRRVPGGMDIYRMDGVKATITHRKSTTITKGLQLTSANMAQAPTHPLLSLPDDEIIQKIPKMSLESLEETLKFSLISERCKDLVTLAGIRGSSFSVLIRNRITIMIYTVGQLIELDFYTEPDMYWGMGANGRKKRLTPPQSITPRRYLGRTDTITFESMKKDGTMKNWVEHLQSVFNYRKIDEIQFSENSSEFDIDDIKAVFGIPTEVVIGNTGCFVFNQMIIQKFFSTKDLRIKTENFRDSKIPPNVLMQNFDTLNIQRDLNALKNITLDELLLINSKVITIENLQMSPKQLNQFIKLWQRGSNPRLERLWIQYENANEDDKEIVMRGIKHEVVPDNRRRMFKSVGMTDPYPVTDGIDIHRMDGVKATIQFDYEETFSIVEMFVWMDHCVVE
ncbi:unnamed protein product [Caenorhabditis brenneri]